MSQVGAPCPDHLINTKHKPLVVAFDPGPTGRPSCRSRLREGVDEYASGTGGYYAAT